MPRVKPTRRNYPQLIISSLGFVGQFMKQTLSPTNAPPAIEIRSDLLTFAGFTAFRCIYLHLLEIAKQRGC